MGTRRLPYTNHSTTKRRSSITPINHNNNNTRTNTSNLNRPLT